MHELFIFSNLCDIIVSNLIIRIVLCRRRTIVSFPDIISDMIRLWTLSDVE